MGLAMGHVFVDGGRPNSLVFHHQFHDDCFVFERNGRVDHAQNVTQRYLEVQSVGNERRGSRRERVEVGARRRVSNARGEWVVSGARRDRGSNFSLHVCHVGVCDSRVFVPGE